MIIKFFKKIDIKYHKILKFLFFLKYLILIFFISVSLLLILPKLFDYDSKKENLILVLKSKYNITLKSFSTIEFNILPTPHLEIKNVNISVNNKDDVLIKKGKLKIFSNIKNFYNLKNFKITKINLLNNEVSMEIDKVKSFFYYFRNLNDKVKITNLKISLSTDEKKLIEVKNINFSNFGYKKYKIFGNIFDKRFKVSLSNNLKNLDVKIFNTGIKGKIKTNEKNTLDAIEGTSKINILKNLLKFDFELNKKYLKMKNSSFKNSDVHISFESLIQFKPYFLVTSDFDLKKIKTSMFKNLNLTSILKKREIIRKLNSNNKINYRVSKFDKSIFKDSVIFFELANGRLSYTTKLFFSGGKSNCKGESLLVHEYPRLSFNCHFNFDDKKSFLSKLKLPSELDKNIFSFKTEGSIYILNKKISFNKVTVENKTFKNEDLEFLKQTFEKILFDENIFGVFSKNKIKEFVLEIL